jgi:enediyne biosynthesis protein E4
LKTRWGDYDNDGLLDLFVSSYGQHSALYHNNGDGTFTRMTSSGISRPLVKSTGGAWADYDNDGFLDLFVANDSGTKSFLYHNNGDGTFTSVTNGIVVNDPGNAQGAAWGDYNNDGFPDLFVPNIRTFKNSLYRNDGNSNAWLTVKLEGRVSNRAAIGSHVRVRATIHGRPMWQLCEISGGGSLGSQNDLRAQFGLGDATNVDLVRIEWPSGIVQEAANVSPKQFLIMTEPSALKADFHPANTECRLSLRGGKGLIYSMETCTDLTHWIPLASLTNETGTVTWQQLMGDPVRFFRAKELPPR